MVNIFIYIFIINSIYCLSFDNTNKIIISLTGDKKNIYNSIIIINSIFNQNINEELFGVLLILSINDFNDINRLPEELQILEKMKKIKIKFLNYKITNKLRTMITIKENKYNPILIVNNNCVFPDGWLKMFINDHLKYPNDAIASTIQYFFGKNDEIIELSEGFRGEKFGTFNHVSEMIFNFALIDIDLGGILYPKNYFQNNLFYDREFLKKGADISEEFWESAFIIIDDKILRQSSKIFDYTKLLINTTNYEEYYRNKKKILIKDKLSFVKIFPNFNDFIKKRKSKIIVSVTSYPKRFILLPDLMKFIKNQSFRVGKIFFFLYKNDIKYLNLTINDSKIISTKENLRPHLKYFYAMKLFKDYAIITLDDDVGYDKDTFESLFNEYINNPNVICGRRSHLMTFDKEGELNSYYKWKFEQNIKRNPEFNLILTNVGGSIYPPDILSIKDEFLPIIKETITCDDLTLKYFENIKGIPVKWIKNNNMQGIKRSLPKIKASPLFKINFINNDKCINKLNIMINTTILNNLCVQYRNISTGNIIYLFDIHNKTKIKDVIYFDLYAFSYCPIDLKNKFNIFFDNFASFCFFRESKIISADKNIIAKSNIIATCNISNSCKNLDDYYYPEIKSNDNIHIKIYNYRKYSTIIYKNFYCCEEFNNCFLKVILYEMKSYDNLMVKIKNRAYLCFINNNKQMGINFPIIIDYKCHLLKYFNDNNTFFISGIPKDVNINSKIKDNNYIPTQFIIHKISIKKKKKKIIISGNISTDMNQKEYHFSINVFHPNIILKCSLKPNSKILLSNIYCYHFKNKIKSLLIENQVVHLNNNEEELLLINEETMIKVNFNKINNNNCYDEYKSINYNKKRAYIYFCFFILILIIKFYIF